MNRFAGYAAVFDRVDAGGDMIRRGAFAASLAERRKPLPLYWQHDPARQIGWIESASEDERGLRVIARLEDHVPPVRGLSFGYRARDARALAGHRRELREVEIFEVSLVTHPMQPLARVHLVM